MLHLTDLLLLPIVKNDCDFSNIGRKGLCLCCVGL